MGLIEPVLCCCFVILFKFIILPFLRLFVFVFGINDHGKKGRKVSRPAYKKNNIDIMVASNARS